MPWWESEEQTKQKKKAHRARNWGDPDKGYGVGGGRGPGPGYQEKDYSLRRTLNDLGITRPPGADIPQMESLVQSELNDFAWDEARSQIESLIQSEDSGYIDPFGWEGYSAPDSSGPVHDLTYPPPRYDPTAFRGYGQQSGPNDLYRTDSSFTREPTGEGWGYGMANITRPEMEGYSAIDPAGWLMEEAYRGVFPQGETWEAPVFSAVLGLLPYDDILAPGPQDEAHRFTKALKALKDEGKWFPDEGYKHYTKTEKGWEWVGTLAEGRHSNPWGRNALIDSFNSLYESMKRLGAPANSRRGEGLMIELGNMLSEIVRYDKTIDVNAWDLLPTGWDASARSRVLESGERYFKDIMK